MTVAQFLNQLSEAEAKEKLEHCCAAALWVTQMLGARPFKNDQAILDASELAFDLFRTGDWLEAFAAHPRIGDIDSLRAKFAATKQWAMGEQSAVSDAGEATLTALANGNDDYFEKFGYIFIVCATGKSATEMLEILQARLPNSPEIEIGVAGTEQRKITLLRIKKLAP